MPEVALEVGDIAVGAHDGALEGDGVGEILQGLGRFREVERAVAVLLVVLVAEAEVEVLLRAPGVDDTGAALVRGTLIPAEVDDSEAVMGIPSGSVGEVLGLRAVRRELPDVVAVDDKNGLVAFDPLGHGLVRSGIFGRVVIILGVEGDSGLSGQVGFGFRSDIIGVPVPVGRVEPDQVFSFG